MTRCPMCAWEVAERPVACGRCRVVYHADCWGCLGRCAIYGCGFTQSRLDGARRVLKFDRRAAVPWVPAIGLAVAAACWGLPVGEPARFFLISLGVLVVVFSAIWCLLIVLEEDRWARFPLEKHEGTVRTARPRELELAPSGGGTIFARLDDAGRARRGDLFEASLRRMPDGGLAIERIVVRRPRAAGE